MCKKNGPRFCSTLHKKLSRQQKQLAKLPVCAIIQESAEIMLRWDSDLILIKFFTAAIAAGGFPLKFALGLVGVFAALTDLTSGRVCNALLFPAAALAIVGRILEGGTASIPSLAVSLLLPLVFLPLWGHGFAGGDIKLLWCVTCFLQPKTYVLFLFAALSAGAGIAVPVLICTKNPKSGIPFAVPVCAAILLYLGGVY
jgi:Flp pilus assembly protein protease CpaA